VNNYRAPLTDMRFVLSEILDLESILELPDVYADSEVLETIFNEASKLASEVISPLNSVGDRVPSTLKNGIVQTPPGFSDAYNKFVAGGWNSAAFDPAIGGQGLPRSVTMALFEMWESSNMAFSLCPTLTQGAVECLRLHGSAELKSLYLEKLVSGVWSGTMNLTEPQSGSDLGTIRTQSERDGNHYRLRGTKIFITYGDHDLSENIVHIVLARSPGKESGIKGLSCFLVPKYLVNPDGSVGALNDLKPISIEKKMGIHASPTLTMSYGEDGGAIGYLLGTENKGIEVMFTMMNNARLLVGLEGVAIAERSYQLALNYARERHQGRIAGDKGSESKAIINHPDVRHMLMLMKAKTEAARALAYMAAGYSDHALHNPNKNVRLLNQAQLDLMTPLVKAWCSDVGVEVSSLGIQVHGGTGYMEDTGAAQLARDARIVPIYEGTNGIQAVDLVHRKLTHNDGRTVKYFVDRVKTLNDELVHDATISTDYTDDLKVIHRSLEDSCAALKTATYWLASSDNLTESLAGATNYLKLFGTVAAGYGMALGALRSSQKLKSGTNEPFYKAKICTARFYAEQVLSPSTSLLGPITRGTTSLFSIPPEHMD